MKAPETAQKPLPGFLAFALVAWPFYLNDFYLIPLTRRADGANLLWLLDVIFYFLIPTASLLWLYRKGHLAHVAAALKIPKRFWLHAVAAVFLAFTTHYFFTLHFDLWCFKHGIGRVCGGYPVPEASPQLQYAVMAYASITAGVLEEVIFRAHLFELLRRKFKSGLAISLLSSIAFAAMHWCGGTGKLLATFAISLIPGAIFLRTGNLWLPMIWHALHDFFNFMG